MQLAPTTPVPVTTSGSKTPPPSGDWPLTVRPVPRLTEAQYQEILARVPDRTPPATRRGMDTPDDTATSLVYLVDATRSIADQMAKGVDSDRANFEFYLHTAARFAQLASAGIGAWVRDGQATRHLVYQLQQYPQNLLSAGLVYARDPGSRGRTSSYDLARAVLDVEHAARRGLMYLQAPGAVRERPIGGR